MTTEASRRLHLRTDMADLKAEMYRALHEQTRTLLLANVGMMLSTVSLSFAVAKFA